MDADHGAIGVEVDLDPGELHRQAAVGLAVEDVAKAPIRGPFLEVERRRIDVEKLPRLAQKSGGRLLGLSRPRGAPALDQRRWRSGDGVKTNGPLSPVALVVGIEGGGGALGGSSAYRAGETVKAEALGVLAGLGGREHRGCPAGEEETRPRQGGRG